MSVARLLQIMGKSAVLLLCSLLLAGNVSAQTTAFSYQGRLTDSGAPANGAHDFRFRLYDLPTLGTQQGTEQAVASVPVSSGIFTVQLDFGANVFTANAGKFVEIDVRVAGGPSYTTLPQRQPVVSTPYAVQTLNAAQLGGVAASQYVQTTDSRLTDARTPNGSAGGDLSGSYPSPAIAPGAVTDAKVASGISYAKLSGAPTSLPPSGAAGGDLTSTYPNPVIGASAVTSAKILDGSIVNNDISASAAIAASKISGLGALALLNPTGTANATTYLRGDNSWAPVAAGSTPVFASLNAAVTVTSTNPTYANIVSVTLAANKTYFLEFDIIGNRVGATSGPGTGRLFYTGNANTDWYLISSNYVAPLTFANSANYDQEAAGIPVSYTTTPANRFSGRGYIRTTSAGTLTVQIAKATTNTTVDLSVKEGSFILATPLN